MLANLGGWSAAYAAGDPNAAALYACACDASDAGATCAEYCADPAHPFFCFGNEPVQGGMCESCILKLTCKPQADTCAAN
jgi:hypothetical protein